MEEAGITVHTEPRMPQKAALIDGKIAYFGSQNILSRLVEEAKGGLHAAV